MIHCLLLLPLWDSVIVLCFVMRYFVSFLVFRAEYFALFVFLVPRNSCMAPHYDAMGLFAVCDCGISGPSHLLLLLYKVIFFSSMVKNLDDDNRLFCLA